MELTTFSIAARCRRTGMLGIAISTAVPAVGSLTSFIRPQIGAVVTQSWVNPYLGIDGVALLASGLSATATLDRLLADDPGRDARQLGVVDRDGRAAAFTGPSCSGWAGQVVGDGFAVQGNMLTGPETLQAMAASFGSSEEAPLPDRLVQALEAGQAVGGDKRGRQSAAVKVFATEEYPWLDLRVDEHTAPVAELARVFAVAKRQLLPFAEHLPTRANPIREIPAAVGAMLAKAPRDR